MSLWGVVVIVSACGGEAKRLEALPTPYGEGLVVGRLGSTLTGVPGSWQGTSLSVQHVYEDGVAEPAVEKSVAATAAGDYQIIVPLPDGELDGLVVVAEREGQVVGKVLLAGPLKVNEPRIVAPITPETTAEADVFSAIRAAGQWHAGTSVAMLRLLVSDRTARALAGADDPAALPELADGTAAGMSAWRSALIHPTVGESTARVSMAVDALAAAEQEIDADLHESSSAADREAAEDELLGLFLSAHRSAGMTARALTRPGNALAEAMLVYAEAMPDALAAAVAVSAATIRSAIAVEAVNGEMATAGFGEPILAVARAAALRLASDIDAAALEPATALPRIGQAFTRYNIVVEGEVDNAVDLANDAYLDVRVALVWGRSQLEETLDELSASVTPSVTADIAADAIGNFYWEIDSELNRMGLLDLGYSDEQASAILETLADLHASSD